MIVGVNLSSFVQRLANAAKDNRSLLCVGLDPDPALMPVSDVFAFNREIIDATADLVCAFKPNLPYYEALGIPGLEALGKTIQHIRTVAPNVVILGDSKRGDIASTNVKYAQAMFDVWGFDALTVNAYAGGEALEPFLKYEDKAAFVWCRSSNPGANEIQDLKVRQGAREVPLYEQIAERASEWNTRGNVGLVVGATYPEELSVVRGHAAGMPILIPGVGAQGGDLDESVRRGLDNGVHNILISSSRGILYASKDPDEFGTASRQAAQQLRDQINGALKGAGRLWH